MKNDGILLIDKPRGITSHDVVARVRKALGTRRVGHTGTLDPFATGLLPICINRATRLVQYLTADLKEYLAIARFGIATTTGDLTGTPLGESVSAAHITTQQLADAAKHLTGHIQQIPPMYSAKKINGVKLYEMARQGIQVERQPVTIEVSCFEILSEMPSSPATTNSQIKDFAFRVVCSAGTYVRVLAEDLASLVGSKAHLIELQRTRVGTFQLSQAISPEQLTHAAQQNTAEGLLIPMRLALTLPEILVNANEQIAIAHGQPLQRAENWPVGQLAKLCHSNGELLAIASFEPRLQGWQPRVVLCEPAGKTG